MAKQAWIKKEREPKWFDVVVAGQKLRLDTKERYRVVLFTDPEKERRGFTTSHDYVFEFCSPHDVKDLNREAEIDTISLMDTGEVIFRSSPERRQRLGPSIYPL